MNEWLEMDVIVLARRIMEIKRCVELKDETERAGREAKERAMALCEFVFVFFFCFLRNWFSRFLGMFLGGGGGGRHFSVF